MENQNDKDKRDTGLPCDGDQGEGQRLYFVADATHEFIDRSRHGRAGRRSESADRGELGDAGVEELERRGREVMQGRTGELLARQAGPCNGFWRDAVWLPCRDGKARPTARGIHPLVVAHSNGRNSGAEREQRGREQRQQQKDGGNGRGQGPTQPCLQSMASRPTGNLVRDGDPISPNDSPEARVLRLRGYGNAICAPVAEEFIRAYIKVSHD